MALSKPEQKQPKIAAETSDSQMNQHVVSTPPNKTPPVIMVGADEAIPQLGGLVGAHPHLELQCALTSEPALADGYGFVSNQVSAYRRNSIIRNVEINSTGPRNSPGHPTKKPKQGCCFSWLFG